MTKESTSQTRRSKKLTSPATARHLKATQGVQWKNTTRLAFHSLDKPNVLKYARVLTVIPPSRLHEDILATWVGDREDGTV